MPRPATKRSARAGGMVEKPWDALAPGQRVFVEGYPSRLPSSAVRG
jgi:hypothetical protein